MAKKRGRPPKTPTSTSKGLIDETVRPTQTPQKPDFSGLDEEELADIDSLTPKEALLWMEKIDLLRERVKEKTNPKPFDDPTVACGTSKQNEALIMNPNFQNQNGVKKVWIVKKKPEQEDQVMKDSHEVDSGEKVTQFESPVIEEPLEESVPETQDLQSAGLVKQHQSDSLGANAVDQEIVLPTVEIEGIAKASTGV
ncbi:hypothetical protein RIF29_26254 [Crotalaria pallida]|uniref:Uncharacterized protein n=1 Tax=Crotalaria pallida TaxID=3830 RepID=A0AAN9EN47_CROPI